MPYTFLYYLSITYNPSIIYTFISHLSPVCVLVYLPSMSPIICRLTCFYLFIAHLSFYLLSIYHLSFSSSSHHHLFLYVYQLSIICHCLSSIIFIFILLSIIYHLLCIYLSTYLFIHLLSIHPYIIYLFTYIPINHHIFIKSPIHFTSPESLDQCRQYFWKIIVSQKGLWCSVIT